MSEKEMIRRWAQTWKEFGPELEKIRLREVHDEDNLLSLRLLARAFNHANKHSARERITGADRDAASPHKAALMSFIDLLDDARAIQEFCDKCGCVPV